MSTQVVSRYADHGLPDVRNDFRCSDGTYYFDGTTTGDMKGSVLQSEQTEERVRIGGPLLRRIFGEI